MVMLIVGNLTDEPPDAFLGISEKNTGYRELTAVHYIWKNTGDTQKKVEGGWLLDENIDACKLESEIL